MMRFEWDEEKSDKNRQKHGIDFETAQRGFADPNFLEQPDNGEYDEKRWNRTCLVSDIELVITYTERASAIRIISARRAKRHEREEYWNDLLRS